MIKRLAAALAVALAVSTLAALAGCGSGAQQSEDLMTTADRKMMANWKAVGTVRQRTDDLISWLSETLDSWGGLDEGGFYEAVAELRDRLADIQSEYDEAGAEYQRMVEINAPGGYATYARLKLREIGSATALLNELEGFLIRTSQRLAKTGLESGWFTAEVERFNKQFDELHKKTVNLGLHASAVRKRDDFGRQGPLPSTSPVVP